MDHMSDNSGVAEPTSKRQKPSADCTGRVALITGITGQDGSYLAECAALPACARLTPLPRPRALHQPQLQGLCCGSGCTCAPPRFLLKKGYDVHGIIRRSSSFNTGRIEDLYQDPHVDHAKLFLHYGDLTDSTNLFEIISKVRPDELYNLGAQSHVKVSFEMSEYTADCDGIGVLRMLNAIRSAGLSEKTRFYQASTSELYGLVQEVPQSETTPFYPRSPYAVAKQYAYWIVVNYREAYGMHLSNGILFNHESPRRGPTFVTRKVTRAVARIKKGLQDRLYMGNIDAKRDWGHARDYVQMMWMMMQQEEADDYVVATGETHTVRSFVELAFKVIDITIKWRGKGVEEEGYDAANPERVLVKIDPKYFRPTEVELLIGDPTKAKKKLGWVPQVKMEALCREMVLSDIALVEKGDMTS